MVQKVRRVVDTGRSILIKRSQLKAVVHLGENRVGNLYILRYKYKHLWHVRRNGDTNHSMLCGKGNFYGMHGVDYDRTEYKVCEKCWRLAIVDQLA